MDFFDFVIVGSGPSGVAAARRLKAKSTCIIDVGNLPKEPFPHTSLSDALKSRDKHALLGSQWEMLACLLDPHKLHPKLRAAGLRHVASGEKFCVSNRHGNDLLISAGSHAAGGMSNAWGAQLLRYTDLDISDAKDWPIGASHLEPYYQDLEQHIGISGSVDDMYEFLGSSHPVMPPVLSSPTTEVLIKRYQRQGRRLAHRNLILGRPRLAITTQQYQGRPIHRFGETEFFTTNQDGFYSATTTLNELKSSGQITYMGEHRLISWRELPEYVDLVVLCLKDGVTRSVRARHVLLGCGTIQTSQMVLKSRNALGKRLSFIDHLPTLLPIFIPAMFGSQLPTNSYPIQLIGTLTKTGHRDMMSFYYPGGLLWSDLLPDIPLPMAVSSRIIGGLLAGMLVVQIWETSRPSQDNWLSLSDSGDILIRYGHTKAYARVGTLLSELRQLGAYSLSRLANQSPPGWGFHHVGTLPMRHSPSEFETHTNGCLWDSKRIHIIDGSVLPSLPGKNHTLTIMANSARIADEAIKCEY